MSEQPERLVFAGREKSAWVYTEEYGVSTLTLAPDGSFVFTHADPVVQTYHSNDEDELVSEVSGVWSLGPGETVVLRPSLPFRRVHRTSRSAEPVEPPTPSAPDEVLGAIALSRAACEAGTIATPWRPFFKPRTRRHNMAERLARRSGEPAAFFARASGASRA